MTNRPFGQTPKTSVIAGLTKLAQGDATGILHFGHTPRAFLLSLVPMIALPLTIGFATILSGAVVQALEDLTASLCVLLLPPFISHTLAKVWKREEPWLRFAIAFNWCQFALSVLCIGALLTLGVVLGTAGASANSDMAMAVVALMCLGIVGYGLWLHWFVARCGLAVSGGRAALVVLATYAGTFAILLIRGAMLANPA
jgi:hypothetical protein